MTEDIRNETTKDYFRKSVTQLFLTYPDLKGIGITAGENMHDSPEEKEEWIFETCGKGILDAARQIPDRDIVFLHRQHMTGAPEIAAKFKPLEDEENVEFLFSFKYAVAHVMSATRQYRHQQFVKDIQGMETIWTLRNDSNYYFRWGAPDFVREFIGNIPYDVSRGFYYGSDQWIWGREFTSRHVEGKRPLEIVKHWYHWMMWGRLGYDPHLGNDRFVQILASRFPGIDARQLFTAWQEASLIYPTTTGFHWGAADYMWHPEGCKSRPRFTPNNTGFHDVNDFIDLPPHPKSGYQSIPEFGTMVRRERTTDLVTPLQVAEKLYDHADKALSIIEPLDPGQDKELQRAFGAVQSIKRDLGDSKLSESPSL